MMKQRNVSSLEDLIALARELQVKTFASEMLRAVMGIKPTFRTCRDHFLVITAMSGLSGAA
jgi:peroxiredoxin family protein